MCFFSKTKMSCLRLEPTSMGLKYKNEPNKRIRKPWSIAMKYLVAFNVFFISNFNSLISKTSFLSKVQTPV